MPKRIKITDEEILHACKIHTYQEAAKILGISASTCYGRCRKYNQRKPAGKIKGKYDKINYKND